MMSIIEYAEDMKLDVKEVMKLCEDLEIVYQDENTVLSESDIILLDNSLNVELVEPKEELEFEEVKKSAFKRRANDKNFKEEKENYFKKRKKVYKNKKKLQKNDEKDQAVFKEKMTVKELADVLEKDASKLLQKTFDLGMMLNINSILNYEVASLLADEYGINLKKEEEADISDFENFLVEDKAEDLVKRPPVITIMGHVDHGKTTLLDAIRSSNLASLEKGGITQAVDSYQVEYKGEKLTFIDTPGHEAFTDMRSRGAQVTDIVIIIVAADDGVNAQTEEAIDHAKASGVPIIVAINKIDKADANVEKTMTEITETGLVPEEYGGDIIVSKISAKDNIGIDELLDNIILVSEMEELKANPKRYAMGSVIEAKKDEKVGTVATLLVQNGTLRLGDPIVVGNTFGKVRTMENDLKKALTEAGPSTPITITGLPEVPDAGDKFMAFETEKEARTVAEKRARRVEETTKKAVALDDLFSNLNDDRKVLNLLIKADLKGSLEAIKESLNKLEIEGTTINIIRGGVGAISESDVILASASDAVILGFGVITMPQAREIAKERQIDIRLYDIIYKLIEDLKKALKGMLDPEYVEENTGYAEIQKIFKFSKVGNIAGCRVQEGKINRKSKIRLSRNGKIIFTGELDSLKKGEQNASVVSKGEECGLTIKDYQDIKEGDIIEAFELKEKEIL